MSIFGPVKKTQGVLKPPGAYFYGGFDSTFWHFGANAKMKWAATVHWVLHSQVVLKTVVSKRTTRAPIGASHSKISTGLDPLSVPFPVSVLS